MIHELFTPAIDFSSGLISTHFAEGVWEGGAAGLEVCRGRPWENLCDAFI